MQKDVAVSTGLISTVLTEHLERQHSKDLHPVDYFRASSCGHCPRKQVAMRAGLPETFPATQTAVLKMWMGTELGKLFQATLEADGFLERSWTEREVRYRSYVGHVDGLTRKLPDDGTQGAALVEIKTTADDSITKYDWPEHYPWQGGLYLLATGLRRELMFQIGREYGLSREKVFILTEEWRDKIETHITKTEQAWELYCKTKELPPCEHQFKWEDKTCGYREPKVEKEPTEKIVRVPNPFQTTERSKELAEFLDEVHTDTGEIKP